MFYFYLWPIGPTQMLHITTLNETKIKHTRSPTQKQKPQTYQFSWTNSQLIDAQQIRM